MAKTRKRAEPKPPPILHFATPEQTKDATKIVRLLGQVLTTADDEMPGEHAKLIQFLSGLINPHATDFRYKDHTGKTQVVTTFSSKVAAERRAAFDALRAKGLTHEEVGALAGLSRSAIVAQKERAEGRRAKQKRITLKDAEVLAAAKEIRVPPVSDPGSEGTGSAA